MPVEVARLPEFAHHAPVRGEPFPQQRTTYGVSVNWDVNRSLLYRVLTRRRRAGRSLVASPQGSSPRFGKLFEALRRASVLGTTAPEHLWNVNEAQLGRSSTRCSN